MPYKLIVFDLDFTLWNAGGTWCDQTCPPYRKENGILLDNHNNKIVLYPDVIKILDYLYSKGYISGLASRTTQPLWAIKILELFDIAHFFEFKEIYPGTKTEHFRQIKNKSGIQYSDMIFFDDEQRNIEDVERLGVKAVLLKKEITLSFIDKHIIST